MPPHPAPRAQTSPPAVAPSGSEAKIRADVNRTGRCVPQQRLRQRIGRGALLHSHSRLAGRQHVRLLLSVDAGEGLSRPRAEVVGVDGVSDQLWGGREPILGHLMSNVLVRLLTPRGVKRRGAQRFVSSRPT